MRRTLQICAVPRSRAFATPSSTRFLFSSGSRRGGVTRHALRHEAVSIRGLHCSSFLQQEHAAAAPAAAEGPERDVITRFDELGTEGILHRNVVEALTRDMKLETMTEVQSRTINEAVRGDDIIAQAKTGTGKTLAFLIPILQNIIAVDPQLATRGRGHRGPRTTADDIRALIVSPTRELAEQIAEEARKLVRYTGLVVQTAVGGTHKRAGLHAIQRQGCHILVGTPGRLNDILSDPDSRVEAPDLSALVLDEADRLLDSGFWPEVQEIMRRLPSPTEKDRQTLMFSATVPKEVVSVVRRTLKPNFQFVKCVRDDEEPTHERVPQRVVTTNGLENGLPAVVELCSKAVAASKEPGGKPFKAIVYFNSTSEVGLAARLLQSLKAGGDSQPGRDAFGMHTPKHPWAPIKIEEIHSKLTQASRTAVADRFKRSESAILLSSDVTSRGMDFPNVTHVIQVGLAPSREQYIHRIGRTARAGKEGEGWLIINHFEASEARRRLTDLPLIKDESLATAKLDLTQPAEVPPEAGTLLRMYQIAMRSVDVFTKAKVYKAYLGVYQWVGDKQALVDKMNNLSKFGWGLASPPRVARVLINKLGMSRVQGLELEDNEYPGASDDTTMRGDRNNRRSFFDRGKSMDRSRSRNSYGASFGRRDRNNPRDTMAKNDPFSL